jgi:hypothetical protein
MSGGRRAGHDTDDAGVRKPGEEDVMVQRRSATAWRAMVGIGAVVVATVAMSWVGSGSSASASPGHRVTVSGIHTDCSTKTYKLKLGSLRWTTWMGVNAWGNRRAVGWRWNDEHRHCWCGVRRRPALDGRADASDQLCAAPAGVRAAAKWDDDALDSADLSHRSGGLVDTPPYSPSGVTVVVNNKAASDCDQQEVSWGSGWAEGCAATMAKLETEVHEPRPEDKPHNTEHSPVVIAQWKERADDWQLRLADRITTFAGSMPFV